MMERDLFMYEDSHLNVENYKAAAIPCIYRWLSDVNTPLLIVTQHLIAKLIDNIFIQLLQYHNV